LRTAFEAKIKLDLGTLRITAFAGQLSVIKAQTLGWKPSEMHSKIST